MYEFCRRRLSRQDLEQAAGARRDDGLLWAAPHFFAATEALSCGDRERALRGFRQCAETYDFADYCYLAEVFVRKLELDPTWPAWLPVAKPGPAAPDGRPDADSAVQ